jgi:hypothetical protein
MGRFLPTYEKFKAGNFRVVHVDFTLGIEKRKFSFGYGVTQRSKSSTNGLYVLRYVTSVLLC